MVLQLTNKHLNFSGVDANKLDSNFEKTFYNVVRQFNEAKSYNDDAKLNTYNSVQIKLETYIEIYKGTNVLNEYASTIKEIYTLIQNYKVNLQPWYESFAEMNMITYFNQYPND